jgi:hypothetical protein
VAILNAKSSRRKFSAEVYKDIAEDLSESGAARADTRRRRRPDTQVLE